MTKVLIAAGCKGASGHMQPWDRVLPKEESLVVWRRSVPHARQWPNITGMVGRLRLNGYDVRAVVTTRNWYCASRSQIKACHVPDAETALANLSRAYVWIFEHLSRADVPYAMCHYDLLANRGRHALEPVMWLLDLPMPDDIAFYDGNAKWFKDNLFFEGAGVDACHAIMS